MSERKRKRGRPRLAPLLSYEAEMKRNSIGNRKIKKPKYLADHDFHSTRRGRNKVNKHNRNGDRNCNNSRGYNLDVPICDSEYMYGSDFEEHSDADSESVHDYSEPSEDELDELGNPSVLSDGEMSVSSSLSESSKNTNISAVPRPRTPVPIWLQDRKIPLLVLPPSSDDLLLPSVFVLNGAAIYETLRHFHALIRLSLFRFEEFCAALIVEEQSTLLAEIHMSLYKALIREEDVQQTHFGPIDQKDSINITLHSCDAVTWPETLRLYLQCSPEFKDHLEIFDSCNYPFTTLQNRLRILQFLCDQFLQTSVAREELISEGTQKYDDHCRVCHKTGELLCCDSCSAVYHLDCIDPPLTVSPSELDDWTCSVCISHKVKGVSDCNTHLENLGHLCRQDPLGFDRHGRKYWYLARRLFIESDEGELWYYSTESQLEELLLLLDSVDFEEELCSSINEIVSDIRKQMAVTTALTKEYNGNLPIYLDSVDEKAASRCKEIKIKKEQEKGTGLCEAEVKDVKMELDATNGDVKEELVEVKKEDIHNDNKDLVFKDPVVCCNEVKIEEFCKEKQKQIFPFACEYRLGCDHSYKSYSNLYSTNTLALNKLQHNEDRDKKRHLSHKFSLSSASEFKWNGNQSGSEDAFIATVRQTLLSIEQNISTHFFHPHWTNFRKVWVAAVAASSHPRHFSRVLTWLIAFAKPVIFNPVWSEQLGHVRYYRTTIVEREEKKKQEKKERKEAELEETKPTSYIKYTLGLKHQIYKQKGEEYRIHGMWSWQWVSYLRKSHFIPMSKLGLRAGPDKVIVPIKGQNGIRGLPVNSIVFKQLSQKTPGLHPSLLSPKQLALLPDITEKSLDKKNEIIISTAGGQQKVEVTCINLEDYFEDGVINVSQALSTKSRFIYCKIVKPSTLDSFLALRLSQEEEARKGEKENSNDADSSPDTDATDSDDTLSDTSEKPFLEDLNSNIKLDNSVESKEILQKLEKLRIHYENLDRLSSFYYCYSYLCRIGNYSNCYSPFCLAKQNAKILIIQYLRQYKKLHGISLDQPDFGIYDPIKIKTVSNNSDESKCEDRFNKFSMDDENSCSSANFGNKATCKEVLHKSTKDTFFLKKVNENKKPKKSQYKFPPISSFKIGKKPNEYYSIFILPRYELRGLARKGGRFCPQGFTLNSKTNNAVWAYPCSRPSFKITWLYRTALLHSPSAAALQLRILWSCLRWDDMQEKGSSDGRKQGTTETEIIQTEILKRKHFGRFLENTEYLRRKVTIPLDVPKPVREFTPSQRSGLRKRKRASSPIAKKPESIEEWIAEEKLDLWEIKYFGDRIEKAAIVTKRTLGDKGDTVQTLSHSGSPADIMAHLADQLKLQINNFNQKKLPETADSSKGSLIKITVDPGTGKVITASSSADSKVIQTLTSPVSDGVGKTPTIKVNRIISKNGKVFTLKAANPQSDININVGNSSLIPLTKLQVSPQTNNIIRLKTVSGGDARVILPRTSTAVSLSQPVSVLNQTTSANTQITSPVQNQQIQIIKMSDGQIQIRGLVEGQKVIQCPDGKFQIISTKLANLPSVSTSVLNSNMQQKKIVLSESLLKTKELNAVKLSSPGQVLNVNGQTVFIKGKNEKKVVSVGANDVAASNILGAKTGILSGQCSSQITNVLVSPETATRTTVISKQPAIAARLKSPVKPLRPSGVENNLDMANKQQIGTGILEHKKEDTITIRVQVRMTDKGARTIIQGLQPGAGLTKDHIMAIQQKVKFLLSEYHLKVGDSTPFITMTFQHIRKEDSTSKGKPLDSHLVSKPNEKTASPPSQALNSQKSVTSSGKFVITSDYIKKSIQTALSSDDLPPDVEEKLFELQKYTAGQPVSTGPDNGLNKKVEADFDWSSNNEKETFETLRAKPRRVIKSENGTVNKQKKLTNKIEDTRKKIAVQTKRESLLKAHKELLKKDILKKRAILEKQLQIHIHKELMAAKEHLQLDKPRETHSSPPRKKTKMGSDDEDANLIVATDESSPSPKSKSNRSPGIKTKNSSKKSKLKNKKIVCICRTPFDDTKFYVGCDLCGNWFHGDCVGITEALSRSMTEYVCDDCANAKLNKELFCFCRQPYDETQFYICCEQCEDWFHGRCVGIMQTEADDIDDYICPQCNPNNQWNYPCQKKLTNKEYVEIKKVSKILIQHKNAWPFLEPVDPNEVPDYYKVVKEPMDLKMVENRVEKQQYEKLQQFVGDVLLVLDNCRLYNPPNSSFCSCANSLESFFCSKLRLLKQKLSQR